MFGDFKHAVFLSMILQSLGPGEHHVVVGHDNGLGVLIWEQIAIDAANAADHAVTGCVFHEVLHGSAAALGGNGQRAIFDERLGVAQIFDIFTGRSMLRLSALGDRRWPVFIEAVLMSEVGFGQIGANVVEINERIGGRIHHGDRARY